jgi:hypothetical protein
VPVCQYTTGSGTVLALVLVSGTKQQLQLSDQLCVCECVCVKRACRTANSSRVDCSGTDAPGSGMPTGSAAPKLLEQRPSVLRKRSRNFVPLARVDESVGLCQSNQLRQSLLHMQILSEATVEEEARSGNGDKPYQPTCRASTLLFTCNSYHVPVASCMTCAR